MNGKPLIGLVPLIFLLVLTGCAFNRLDEPIVETPLPPAFTSTADESFFASPSLTQSPTDAPVLDWSSVEGPVLLIQTDFDQYQYIDLKTQVSYPFTPPASVSQLRLRANLSPSGRQMYLPVDDESGLIVDIRTDEVIHTYEHSSQMLFNPETAAIKAAPLVTELGLSQSGLLDAVSEAHQRSRQLLNWFQSDRYHLSVQDTGETSTSLFLDDHQTGSRLRLEALPGLVEDYRVGSDGNLILLRKGLVFWPGAYRDSAYYLLNVEERSTQPVVLPAELQNPSVTWFSADTIGVIHQAFMAGGSGYSLINIDSMEASQIVTGEFSDLRRFGELLLVILQDTDSETTRFDLITTEGESVAAQEIDRRCYYQYALINWLMFQCELESFLMDQSLTFEPFYDSVLSLSSAPNGNNFVLVNRSDQVFLLDADLNLQSELQLEEAPLEIFWLLDSNGFLYRTYGKLFYFDLTQDSNQLLIESDLFSDYINLNAVWVTQE